MTPTIHLDPDALEAAAKAHIANTVRATYSVTGLPAAITAYIASIEPRLRERVRAVITASHTIGAANARNPHDATEWPLDEAEDALFALFGLKAHPDLYDLGLEPNE